MSPIEEYWNTLQNEYHNQPLSDEDIVKLDELILNEDIENIRNGVMLMSTLAPAAFCRYLTLYNDSMVLNDSHAWPARLLVERALVEAIKAEQMWQPLYTTGVFESMEFRALGNVDFENLTDHEKDFCVRLGKEMVHIPAGNFMMGALEDDEDAYDDEKPRHKVTLTRDFLMGKYAVTQALWQSVMGSNPSHRKGANRPVECVSWFDCVAFCNKLSEQEGLTPAYDGLGDYQVGDDQNMGEDEIESLSAGITCNWNAKGYRLPTEAEWEYSARGGEYHKYSGSDNVDEVAWCDDNSGGQTHPVGQKKPNNFGLYDMSGNVWEWCWDRMEYDEEYEIGGDSVYRHGPVTDPYGSAVGSRRVYRGGDWYGRPMFVLSSFRNDDDPAHRYGIIGFRIECSL